MNIINKLFFNFVYMPLSPFIPPKIRGKFLKKQAKDSIAQDLDLIKESIIALSKHEDYWNQEQITNIEDSYKIVLDKLDNAKNLEDYANLFVYLSGVRKMVISELQLAVDRKMVK